MKHSQAPTSRRTPAHALLRRAVAGALALTLALGGPAWAQVRLPSLGESGSDELSVSAERHLGEQIMRDVRRDPEYLDDPVLLEYLQSIWGPLVQAARQRGNISPDLEASYPFEAFLVRDRSVNAFALPGGYVGVHLALINLTASADELASVLAHELSHITQRHIARSISVNQRQSLVALAGLILGVLAARSNPDAAQAAIMGGQAAAAQGQLAFSRDMEREADRIGQAVMRGAGFAPSGMASMFERLQQANRLNDSGAYPYLRSHPLTSERIAEAQARLGTDPAQAGNSRPEHTLMRARARVLMETTAQAWQRLQDFDRTQADSGDDRLAALYTSVLASVQLRDFARAVPAFAAGERLVAAGPPQPRRAREWGLLGVELAVAQGDAAAAEKRLRALPADASRPRVLLAGQSALLSSDAALLKRRCESLQSWTSDHPGDALAWSELSSCAERQGQKLRAVRAHAEARAALGDWAGAIDRLHAGQRLARSGAGQDFIESSVIDARLRQLEAQRRALMEESRGRGGQREPAQ
ncbi:MAG: Beta-barrel assembly-enhancing protease [Burkholderiaceae bacterium]|nr:Beta-barrel assembly-enhancing protease [Burkholderiaceae bacterium]